MSAIHVEWIALIIFLLLFAAPVVAEIIWLTREASVTTGRAVFYVLTRRGGAAMHPALRIGRDW